MLEQALPDAIGCLAPKGRIAVISFHSLEDRIVKRAFLRAAGKGPAPGDAYGPLLHLQQEETPAQVRLVTKKPITPGRFFTEEYAILDYHLTSQEYLYVHSCISFFACYGRNWTAQNANVNMFA